MPARRPATAPFQPNLFVVARFLDRLAEPGRRWTRASLQAACGVNYDIFRRYLDLLVARGFVDANDERIRLTAAGKAWRGHLAAVLADFLARPPGGAGKADDEPAPDAQPAL